MKANEVRIGNWYDNNENFRQVSPIIIEQLWESKRIWCEPIPLTEEWLFKFGFTERRGDENFSAWWIGMNPVTHDWLFVVKQFKDENKFFFQNGFHTIKYVHQLQNLYFALTGDELTINPNP